MKPIVRILFGSHLYGTNTPDSDLDYKSVHIPGTKDILLQRVQGSVSTQRAKAEGEKNLAGELDEESYSLQRYLSLLADGQTVSIDMLFAPASSLIETSSIWSVIKENKGRMLSKKSAAFVGYCRQQANKYGIKGSRVAAARDAAEFFAKHLSLLGNTAKVFEVDNELKTLVGDHSAIVEQKINNAGHMGRFFECCNRKVAFNGTIKQAAEVFERVHESYGQRAHLAEKNEGIDWKALSHAVRVGREAIELLETGYVTFPLVDAAHILDIKKGRLGYDVVANEIERLLDLVEKASAASSLPDEVDHEFIDGLVEYVYRTEVISG
jgi:hypothetical protein